MHLLYMPSQRFHFSFRTGPGPACLAAITVVYLLGIVAGTHGSTPSEDPKWSRYRAASARQDQQDRAVLAAERKQAGLERLLVAKKGKEFETPLEVPGGSWKSLEASLMAERILSFQTPSGSWAKNVDYSQARRLGEAFSSDDGRLTQGTIDNHATTAQARFVAHVADATGKAEYRAAVERALEWILRAQYPNGGWPQFYPLLGKYHDLITFNDDAMVHVLCLLRDVSIDAEPFTFLSESLKHRAAEGFSRGLDCVLATQICRTGARTGWCGQYDPQTLEPARGRPFEPAALASAETARMVQFLLQLPPKPSIQQAIRSAVEWLRSAELYDLQVERPSAPSLAKGFDCIITVVRGTRGLWARFYDIETNRPVFGDSKGVDHQAMSEIDYSVRVGYDWYVTTPAQVVERLVPTWQTIGPSSRSSQGRPDRSAQQPPQ